MSDLKIITRKSASEDAKARMRAGNFGPLELVQLANPAGNMSAMNQLQKFDALNAMMMESSVGERIQFSGKYGSGFDVPRTWTDGSTMSVRNKIRTTDMFTPKMSSNTLPADWNNLWDAFRVDVSVRKAALETVRQNFYTVLKDPNFTRQIKPTEFDNYSTEFVEYTGHGEAGQIGETHGGSYETYDILIYVAVWRWDLISKLFDRSMTPERVMDSVMVGYNAKRDDLAMSPIIEYAYSGDQQTDANATSDAGRQELLYLTLQDGKDDLSKREHPVTGRRLGASKVKILASSYVAEHIASVASGLPSTNEKRYGALSFIDSIVAYDDEYINHRDRTVTYTGMGDDVALMLIPADSLPSGQDYMQIAVKSDLVVEVDMNPDVKSFSTEERGYMFAEGMWYEGIQYFVQEITLPAW